MLEELAEQLRGSIEGRVVTDESLAGYTTYRLGGPAAVLAEPFGKTDLLDLGRVLAREEGVPVLALGRGSNLVVSDRGFPGLVVRLGARLSGVRQGEDERTIVAGAGTPLPMVANWAARRGLRGLEFLIAIPGSVGGAVRMNAGAHGLDVAGRLRSVTVVDLLSGHVQERPADSLELSYRRSLLGDGELVLEAAFELEPDDAVKVRSRMDSFRQHRAETQPGAVQNAGSVFKNPPGDAAGRLVEAAGLKGFVVGGARVSELHANFFIASDGATAQDVYDLVREVRSRVATEHGIELEPEIRFVGRFEGAAIAGGSKSR